VNRSAVVVLVFVAALASGCTGGSGDKPTVLPTVSALPTTSTPAPIPPQATAATSLGADAFVRFYFTELNRAFRRSAPELVAALSAPGCTTCNNYAKALSASRTAGHFLDADTFLVSEVAAAPVQTRGSIVEVYGTTPVRHQVDASGRVLVSYPADGRFHFEVAAIKVSGGWTVGGIRIAA
jgi:hypothetical protein